MAIKVNGTTVIDDSRNLSNVGGLKTVNGTSIVGSGNISAGASTTFGAVGTYVVAGGANSTGTNAGATVSGSNLRQFPTYSTFNVQVPYNQTAAFGLSGTWRLMSSGTGPNTNYTGIGLWVRIS